MRGHRRSEAVRFSGEGEPEENESANSPYWIPAWKRRLDLTCILLTLPVWLTLMVLVIVWIKITSPGPVIFRQERIGYRGKRFMMFKFRSMKVDAETRLHELHLEQLVRNNSPLTKLDEWNDSRLIKGGVLLRALALDELPQIVNIVRGEMSLVGPRPCTPYELEYYEPWQRRRFNIAPGLTGFWQVNGKNRTTFREMIDLDLEYISRISIRLDAEILLKTAGVIARQTMESLYWRPSISGGKTLQESEPPAAGGHIL